MEFDPKDMNVRTLFKTFPTFNIPIFQRDYSWDRPYYERFLNDIVSGIEVEDDCIKNSVYFIGTMVFSGSKNASKIDVVDGQQRLTVITIILSVIAHKLQQENEEKLADATFRYVKELDDNNEPAPHLVSDTSYPYFDCFVQSKEKKSISLPSSDEEENIKKTYDFFDKVLSEQNVKASYSKFNTLEYPRILTGIRDQILSSLLIAITTPDKESAYMIFEILNAKGKNLASIDLIKNIIFEKLHGDINGQSALADKLWEDTKNELRTRNNAIGFATFYRHYWISKYAKVTNAKLYDSFKQKITPKNKERYIDFLNELLVESKLYIQIISPQNEDYNSRKEYHWLVESLNAFNDYFGVVQSRIALLALLSIKKKNLISTPKFKEAILYLENFIFAYSGIAKNQANLYEANFSKLAIALRGTTSKSQTNNILEEYLYEKFNPRFPDYKEFEENFIKLNYTKKNNSSNLLTKYVLNKISQNLSNKEDKWTDSSVEHILNEDPRNSLSLSIGNLICLEVNLNNEAKNLDYEEKIEIYKKSKYDQVDQLVKEYPNFKLEDIEVRSKKLAAFYYKNIFMKEIKEEE